MKNTPITLILILMGNFLFYNLFGNENYLPGYIIKEKGDTIFGLIDYRNWSRSPNKISFKKQLENTSVTYSPLDIKEFGVKGEIYISSAVTIETSPLNTDQLQHIHTLNFRTDTAFLQTLVNGTKSLYLYKDKDGRESFYISNNGVIELLVYKKYFGYRGKELIQRENNKYIGQLKLYLNDCPSIQTKLQNASYKMESLENIFQSYYKYTNNRISFRKEKEKIQLEVGVVAGLSLTTVNFAGVNYYYLGYTDFDYSPGITAGISFDFILPRNHKKWSFYNELVFTQYKCTGEYYESINDYYPERIDSEIGGSYIRLNDMVRFKHPFGKLFLYINAGISNGVMISEKNYRLDYLEDSKREDAAVGSTRKFETTLLIGTGIKYQKISFEARYDRGSGISNNVGLFSFTKRYSFLLGYSF